MTTNYAPLAAPTFTGTVTSTNNTLMNGTLTVNGDTTMNGKLIMNNKIGIGTNNPQYPLDVASGGINCGRYVQFGQTGYNIAPTNSTADLSLYARLFVQQDTSLNGNLYVANNSIFNNDLSLNGNITIGKFAKTTNISEKVNAGPTYGTSMTFDLNQGSIFTVAPTNSTNFTVNLTNVPTDLNRTFVATLLIDSSTYKPYCNSLAINGTSTMLYYAGGLSNIVTVSGGLITQTFAIINNATTAPWKVISSVTSNYF